MKELDAQIITLTPQLANHFAKMKPWKGDRKLKPNRVEYLKDQLQKGLFHTPQWAIATLHGEQIRVNGKHSSRMLSEADPFPVGLKATVLRFECDTEDEVALVYSRFDRPESSRNLSDIAKSTQSSLTMLSAIPTTLAKLCADGVAYAKTEGMKTSVPSTDDRMTYMRENEEFILWASDFVGSRKFRRMPVVAAMYNTYLRDREVASAFWAYVRDDSHPDCKNATRVFSAFLLTSYTKTVGKSNANALWPSQAFYHKAILAWNAFRRNQPTDLKWYKGAEPPRLA